MIACMKNDRTVAEIVNAHSTYMVHTDKYYSKNLNLGPEEMPVAKNPVSSTVFHADFIASVADTARICYLK